MRSRGALLYGAGESALDFKSTKGPVAAGATGEEVDMKDEVLYPLL